MKTLAVLSLLIVATNAYANLAANCKASVDNKIETLVADPTFTTDVPGTKAYRATIGDIDFLVESLSSEKMGLLVYVTDKASNPYKSLRFTVLPGVTAAEFWYGNGLIDVWCE